jgi:hypothetical protein
MCLETRMDGVRHEETAIDSITSVAAAEDGADNGGIGATKQKKVDCTVSSPSRLEQWNEPRINAYRFFATLYSFIIMGMNDAASGVRAHDYGISLT